MKTKDILMLVVSSVVIVVCVYFIYGLSGSGQPAKVEESVVDQYKAEFTGVIDEETLKSVKKTVDYGKPNLKNIGRDNPFEAIE